LDLKQNIQITKKKHQTENEIRETLAPQTTAKRCSLDSAQKDGETFLGTTSYWFSRFSPFFRIHLWVKID